MARDIPFARLGISHRLEAQLGADAPKKVRLAIARGLMPLPVEEQLGALYVLAGDEDPEVARTARESVGSLPAKQVLQAVSIKTHPKVLEFIVEFREPDAAVDERVGMLRTANDRTVVRIAERAGAHLCDQLARNHERLLMTPGVFVALHANPHCPDVTLQAAESFLRMQKSMPEVPEVRPFLQVGDPFVADEDAGEDADGAGEAPAAAAAPVEMDVMAEVEAALRGEQSPGFLKAQQSNLDMFDLDALEEESAAAVARGGRDIDAFSFDFADENDAFSWDLTREHDPGEIDSRELRQSLEQMVSDMSVGHKIKLAYRGNKEVRAILVRDSNKIVAAAVVKSGRLTDQEVAAFAGNKNLDNEVLREIAANREYTRKYPVQVALVNNPKTPVSVAVGLVKNMQKKDLLSLTRNRNVPSVVNQAAGRLYKQKYRK